MAETLNEYADLSKAERAQITRHADTELRTAHRTEYDNLCEAKAAELGYKWERQLTAEERTLAVIGSLLDKAGLDPDKAIEYIRSTKATKED